MVAFTLSPETVKKINALVSALQDEVTELRAQLFNTPSGRWREDEDELTVEEWIDAIADAAYDLRDLETKPNLG